jgi:hypothetical protein
MITGLDVCDHDMMRQEKQDRIYTTSGWERFWILHLDWEGNEETP